MKRCIITILCLTLLVGCNGKTVPHSAHRESTYIGSDVLEVEHLKDVVVPEREAQKKREEAEAKKKEAERIEHEKREAERIKQEDELRRKQEEARNDVDDISAYGTNYNYHGEGPDLSNAIIRDMPDKLKQYFYAFRRGVHEVPEGSPAYTMPFEPYIYIYTDWVVNDAETMYHEMGHIYGFYTHAHYLAEWDDIFKLEWNDDSYGATNELEAFAESVAGYFVNESLLEGRPRSYAYINDIFGS